jgi:hypothetical protein
VGLLPGVMALVARPATVAAQLLGVMDQVVPQGIGEAQPPGVTDRAAGMVPADAPAPSAAKIPAVPVP